MATTLPTAVLLISGLIVLCIWCLKKKTSDTKKPTEGDDSDTKKPTEGDEKEKEMKVTVGGMDSDVDSGYKSQEQDDNKPNEKENNPFSRCVIF